jgi:hypothetical protein
MPRQKKKVNNKTDRPITIENRVIKRSVDLCYLGSTVSENGGVIPDVSWRIQKAGGAFAKLQKVCWSTLMQTKRQKLSMLVLNLRFYIAVRPGWSQMN